MISKRLLSSTISLVCALPFTAYAQTPDRGLPHIDHSGMRPALIVDGAPYLMLGAQMNNSSAWPDTMPAVWSSMEQMNVNTVEAPIYWETMEPAEGHYDFTQVSMLLAEARRHNKHLVLLWFGTWKNGSPGYVPTWMKTQPERFPLARKADGSTVYSLSPFSSNTLNADRKAFTALMMFLKANDRAHTVLMVQVENETGMWGSMRDHSYAAQQAFTDLVPPTVLRAMGKPEAHGNWQEVFGADADEFFCAWSIARFVQEVAASGKSAYPLPLYTNAALRDPIHPGGAGSFESGGPTFDALPLWHAITPALDGINPDIYMPEYEKYMAVLPQYALPWNAFFVPETGNSTIYAHYFFAALARGAFGWSPFGMDATGYVNYPLGAAKVDEETVRPFRLNFAIAAPMMRELATWVQKGLVHGTAERTDVHTEEIAFAASQGTAWKATVSYGQPSFYTDKPAPGNPVPTGEALIVALAADEFLVTGADCRIDFTAQAHDKQRMWVTVEEGSYRNGIWVRSRLWNGDQTDYGLNFARLPQILRVRLAAY